LGREHDLSSSLSQVESRKVGNDYTLRFEGQLYQIDFVSLNWPTSML
jgi:hypothetical protein